MFKQLAFSIVFLCTFALNAVEIDFRWIEKEESSTIEAIETVFMEAFTKAYSPIPLETLGITNLQEFLQEAFDEERAAIINEEVACLVAESAPSVIAFATCKEIDQRRLYLSQMAVHPDYWRQHVGKNLLITVIERHSEMEEVVYLTRRINRCMLAFSKAIGATECDANEIQHQAYLDPKKYVAFSIPMKKLKPLIKEDKIPFPFFGAL